MTENEITYKIRHAIFDVYNELGPGLLESVYQEAMTYQMRIDGLKVDEQVSVPVIYKGLSIGFSMAINKFITRIQKIRMIF